MQPTVSVVISTFNRSSVVGNAIQSVLDQSYEKLEVIVVDDGSEDDTEKVVTDIEDPRVNYIRHKQNKGFETSANLLCFLFLRCLL